MNTDEILDFIVNYYIWFIVGGLIIIMAIIGFVADKKKLFPSQKKPGQTKKKKKDEFNFDDEILDDENSQKENKELYITDNNVIVENANSKPENFKDSWDIQPEVDNEKDEYVNNDDYEKQSLEDNYTDLDDNYVSNDTENVEYNQNKGIESTNGNYETESKQVEYANDSMVEEAENNNSSYDYQDDLYREKVEEIKEDINKIDDMFPSNSTSNLEEKEEVDYKQETDYTNVGDNPEQTLQVNYSQLREMVEDIIAETQSENNQKESDNEQIVVNNQTVEDVPLPNLDHISVDAIKAQDEDEDDVWKF